MQQALDGWAIARSDLLKLGPRPLPWMIFYEARCAWHIAADPGAVPRGSPGSANLRFEGNPVPVTQLAHGGRIRLPDGKTIPLEPTAFTSPYPGARGSYFVVALPDLWRTRFPNDPGLHRFFLGVASHELTHTTQLTEILAKIAAARKSGVIPRDVSDDLIEETFGTDPAYLALFERERDLFFDAAAEKDDAGARALLGEALALLDERHRRFFVGERKVWRTLDGLFLNMEGVAGWVQHELARRHPAIYAAEDSILRNKGRTTSWSQGEGLAMMLLVDRFVPGWQKRMMAPRLESPVDLLREAASAEGTARPPS